MNGPVFPRNGQQPQAAPPQVNLDEFAPVKCKRHGCDSIDFDRKPRARVMRHRLGAGIAVISYDVLFCVKCRLEMDPKDYGGLANA